jgi:hypothetical protein
MNSKDTWLLQHIRDKEGEIQNAAQDAKYLNSKQLTIAGELVIIEAMVGALFHIMQM